MGITILASLIGLFIPLPLWAIGIIYTGAGAGQRDFMELSATAVHIEIQDRIARTRTDQTFTNRDNRIVEAVYEFKLPADAIITDLVLWVGDKPIRGVVLEREAARQAYNTVVRRRVDPALVEQIDAQTFRLRIFPFPPLGSRRVELEYMQVLAADAGIADYVFPLAPEGALRVRMDRFSLRAELTGQHPFSASAAGVPASMVDLRRRDERRTEIRIDAENFAPDEDLRLSLRQQGSKLQPTILSFPPFDGEMGYYALWLPPLRQLAADRPAAARSITFAIDISSSMQGGRLDAVKAALAAALAELPASDLFNIVAFGTQAQAWASGLRPATAANKAEALRFATALDALGVTHFAAAFRALFAQDFPAGYNHHVVFLTDGHATLGESGPRALRALFADLAPTPLRAFTLGIGDGIDQVFLRNLAEAYQGEARFVADEAGMAAELAALFTEWARPVFAGSALRFAGTEVQDRFPAEIGVLQSGREFFQVGRYGRGGAIGVQLSGAIQADAVDLDFSGDLARDGTGLDLLPRLWAQQKIRALELQLDAFGDHEEILDEILQLGLTYRLVTRRTSLFAPDEDVAIDPLTVATERPRGHGLINFATAVEETRATTTWLGRSFYLEDGVWIDERYRPGMALAPYTSRGDQPRQLLDFARLGQDMIVVVDGRAYKIAANQRPPTPALSQNAPNPFNSSTLIRVHIPAALASAPMRLSVYNLAGQRIRQLPLGDVRAGDNEARWDGRDDRGRTAASGVYIYRLEGEGLAISRRMLLLR